MDTQAGNKLIAEFMGLKPFEDSRYGVLYTDPTNKNHGSVFGHSGLKYHESYEWLMPVWFKISSLQHQKEQTGITVHEIKILDSGKTKASINYRIKFNGIGSTHKWIDAERKNPIEAVWIAVTKFIQWYNTVKPVAP